MYDARVAKLQILLRPRGGACIRPTGEKRSEI